MPETKPTNLELWPLFQKFCAKESIRYGIDEPFYQDGRLFATDGVIAVSVVADVQHELCDRRVPNMSKVMDYTTEATENWPADVAVCNECDGSGTTSSVKCQSCGGSCECEACDGDGTEYCDCCGHDNDCDECDGFGVCSECNGNGTVAAYESECNACSDSVVDIGGIKLDVLIARKISLLNNVRWGFKSQGTYVLIAFEAEGGIRGATVGKRSEAIDQEAVSHA